MNCSLISRRRSLETDSKLGSNKLALLPVWCRLALRRLDAGSISCHFWPMAEWHFSFAGAALAEPSLALQRPRESLMLSCHQIKVKKIVKGMKGNCETSWKEKGFIWSYFCMQEVAQENLIEQKGHWVCSVTPSDRYGNTSDGHILSFLKDKHLSLKHLIKFSSIQRKWVPPDPPTTTKTWSTIV